MRTLSSKIPRSIVPLVLMVLAISGAKAASALPDLVPAPAQMTAGEGAGFTITENTRIAIVGNDAAVAGVAKFLSDLLARGTGWAAPIVPAAPGKAQDGAIVLKLVDPGSHPEAYTLECDEHTVLIRAETARGLFYGVQTLRQMLPPEMEAGPRAPVPALMIPAVSIRDEPRFSWRGFMLDCGRHLFSKAEIEKVLDIMALQKLNVFHWHLTDDQGWRIEIRKYPRLTEVGAWRSESPTPGTRTGGDGKPYGGFYTQADVREIVAYAHERFIVVVPEIELPGHCSAALAAYPELGNTDVPGYHPEVSTHWGVHRDIYAPKEETFRFLEDVLGEVIGLFPDPYVHIGGDEVPRVQWQASAVAQEFMRSHDLKTEAEIESYFVRRMEKFLNAHGRRIIGWDEIEEGGVTPTATLMVWHPGPRAVQGLEHGNDIVMSPTSNCYFDYYQGDPKRTPEPDAMGRRVLPLRQVYGLDPFPEEFQKTGPEALAHVRGVQGNLWTEHIADNWRLEYMAFPRLCALAEVGWSSAATKNYSDFCRRLPALLRRLRALRVSFRPPTSEDLEPPSP